LSFDILGQIAEALSESDLPYKVDIVDLATTEPAFRERIRSSCVPFEIGDPHPARYRADLSRTAGEVKMGA
jgi:hypothetical protein